MDDDAQKRSWWWRHAAAVVVTPAIASVCAWMIAQEGDLVPATPSVFWNAVVLIGFLVSGLVAVGYLVEGRWTPDGEQHPSGRRS